MKLIPELNLLGATNVSYQVKLVFPRAEGGPSLEIWSDPKDINIEFRPVPLPEVVGQAAGQEDYLSINFVNTPITVSVVEAGDTNDTCPTSKKCGYSQGFDEDADNLTFSFGTNTLRPVGRACGTYPCDLKIACVGADDDAAGDLDDAKKCTFDFNSPNIGLYDIPFKVDVNGVDQVEPSTLRLIFKPVPEVVATPFHMGTKIVGEEFTGTAIELNKHYTFVGTTGAVADPADIANIRIRQILNNTDFGCFDQATNTNQVCTNASPKTYSCDGAEAVQLLIL